MTNPPMINGDMVKQNLEAISFLEPEKAAKIMSAISIKTIQAIQSARRKEWVPLEYDIELTESVYSVVGELGTYQFFHDTMLKAAVKGLLGPILQGTIRLFGISPATFLKRCGSAWYRTFKNCGDVFMEENKSGGAIIKGVNCAPTFIKSRPYLVGFAGSFAAAFSVCGVDGRVTIGKIVPQDRSVEFLCSWTTDKKK